MRRSSRNPSLTVGALFAAAAVLCQAAAIRDGNRVSIPDSDASVGGTIVEFASPASIQFARWWGPKQPILGAPLSLTSLPLTVHATPEGVIEITSSFLQVTMAKTGAITVQTKSGREVAVMPQPATAAGFHLKAYPGEQFYGLGAVDTASKTLDLRGQRIRSTRPLLISNHGYGLFIPRGAAGATLDPGGTGATFDLAKSNPDSIAVETPSQAFQLYYGPNPKEILEQHSIATHNQVNLPESTLENRDPAKMPKELERIAITDANYCDSARILNQLSLSGVVFPAIDVAKLEQHQPSIYFLPFLYDSSHRVSIDLLEEGREPWKHYLIAYLREAHDRGLPFIRPLLMQFPQDRGLETRSDVYMFGDEILVAPGCNVREVELPRGSWTNLRTNTHYAGRQKVANDPKEGLTMYAKAGSLIPFVADGMDNTIELHYFPTPGAEFFVYEPAINEYSQFHAAPSGDFMRIESESRVARTCLWVLHHTPKPKTVGETGRPFREVSSLDAMKPGTWFHDAASGNLHIVVATRAGEDHIVNMSF